MQEPFFELDSTWVMFLTGALIPLLVGLVTKLNTHSAVKAILHLGVAAAASMINVSITLDGVAIISRETLVTFFMTWLTGIATYLGFWLKTGVSPAVNYRTRNFGI